MIFSDECAADAIWQRYERLRKQAQERGDLRAEVEATAIQLRRQCSLIMCQKPKRDQRDVK